MCINGRSDLPGPLCQVLIGYDGTCHIVAAGRANHAGENGGSGPIPAGDGNAQLVGFEIDYNGTQAMSAAQNDAATRATAACLDQVQPRHRTTPGCTPKPRVTGKWDCGGAAPATRSAHAVSDYLAGDDDMVSDDRRLADETWTAETVVVRTTRAARRSPCSGSTRGCRPPTRTSRRSWRSSTSNEAVGPVHGGPAHPAAGPARRRLRARLHRRDHRHRGRAKPEQDTGRAGAVITGIINTLVGLVAGYLAGRTDHESTRGWTSVQIDALTSQQRPPQ